jgi:clan AA aspartic protease
MVICLVDTGFTGALLLPDAIARRLQLPRLGPTGATLADGSRTVLARREAVVDWLTGPESIRALAAPGPTALIGVGLLRSHRLVIDYPARTVEIG